MVNYDRVQETTTTTGTGTITLLGALNASYQAFSVVGNGNTCVYCLTDDATFYEVGQGTYSTTGPTLSRSVIYSSSNGGSAVSLPGTTAFVRLVYSASQYNLIGSSGWVTSGQLGSPVVFSGNIGSGQVGPNHLSFTPAVLSSGVITSGMVGNGAVNSGNIASGQVGFPHLGNGSVQSGTIASGQVGPNHLSFTPAVLSSGVITSGMVGNGAVFSGNIASGQVGQYHIASGSITASQIASGFYVNQKTAALMSGGAFPVVTAETISGQCPVSINSSGYLQVAMASVASRMPAIGACFDNVASGQPANVWQVGAFYLNSGMATWGATPGAPIYCGRSGQIVTASGGFNSGGFQSGDLIQTLGTVLNSGTVIMGTPPAYAFRASGL